MDDMSRNVNMSLDDMSRNLVLDTQENFMLVLLSSY